MSTTPMMLFTLSAVGNSMKPTLVLSWRKTMSVLIWDEVMLTFGILHR